MAGGSGARASASVRVQSAAHGRAVGIELLALRRRCEHPERRRRRAAGCAPMQSRTTNRGAHSRCVGISLFLQGFSPDAHSRTKPILNAVEGKTVTSNFFSEKASLMVPPSRRAGGRGHRRRREPQGGAAPICRRVQDRPRRHPRPRAQFLRRVRTGCADPHRDGAHHRGAVIAIRGGLRNGVRARPLRGRPPTGYPARFRESPAALRNRTASRPKQSSRPPPPIRG
jgi:hypothetical protein